MILTNLVLFGEDGRQGYAEFNPFGGNQGMITLSHRPKGFGGDEPEATVNWAAIGARCPEDAQTFADALDEVIDIARNVERYGLEDAVGRAGHVPVRKTRYDR